MLVGMSDFEDEFSGGSEEVDDGFGEETELADVHGGLINPLEPGVEVIENRFE